MMCIYLVNIPMMILVNILATVSCLGLASLLFLSVIAICVHNHRALIYEYL